MSILIKNMKLPDKDHLILVEIDSNGDVFAAYDSGRTKLTQYKASLISEPHGKLIDADTKLSWEMYDDKYQEWYIKSMTIADALDSYTDEGCPPAIIEAE